MWRGDSVAALQVNNSPLLAALKMKRSREDQEEPSAADSATDKSTTPRSLDADDRATKITELEPAEGTFQEFAMKCVLPPHREAISFKSYDDYEAHYVKTHTNRCLECGRNLPSEHLLNIHHEECHDSFAAVRRERGEHTVSQLSPPGLQGDR